MAFEDRRTSESETPAACAQVARSLRAIVDSDPVGSEVDSGSSAWNGRTRAWSVHAERHTGNRNRGTDSASVVKPMKPLIIRRNSFVILAMNEGRMPSADSWKVPSRLLISRCCVTRRKRADTRGNIARRRDTRASLFPCSIPSSREFRFPLDERTLRNSRRWSFGIFPNTFSRLISFLFIVLRFEYNC